jgi:hypothetical protein
MKKIIFSLAAMLALSCSFISCGNDDDNDITFSTTPEKAAAGTYTGNWTITSDAETVEGSGTITIAPTSTPYNADITIEGSFSTTALDVNATSIANISHANNGFVFNNNATNPLGASFTGKIDDNGTIGVNFQKEVKVGRKQYKYNYVFWGKKN